MGWRFGFAKVAAQVSTFVEDFCKRIRAHFSIFVSLSQKGGHLRPSMLRLHRFLVPLFPRTLCPARQTPTALSSALRTCLYDLRGRTPARTATLEARVLWVDSAALITAPATFGHSE